MGVTRDMGISGDMSRVKSVGCGMGWKMVFSLGCFCPCGSVSEGVRIWWGFELWMSLVGKIACMFV